MTKDNHIEAVYPTDRKWVALAESTVSAYATAEGFNALLADMLAHSVNEACGTLCERAAAASRNGSFRLRLDADAEALTIAITYDSGIPLNPMKEKPYRVPDNPEELDTLEVDSLWLHLIKYRMDRMSFSIDGNRQTLHMVKYRRSEGKEKEIWIMSRKPQLVSGLIMNETETANGTKEAVGYVQNPKTGKVVRLGGAELDAVRQMDGRTAIYDIYMKAVENGVCSGPQRYICLYEALETNRMLCRDNEADNTSRWKRWKERFDHLYVSIPHPDRAVERFYHALRFFFTPAGFTGALMVGISGFYPIAVSGSAMRETYIRSIDALSGHWWMLPVMYAVLTLFTMIHELSHGAACKHYGGYVPRVGIMLYLTSVIFFCDITSSCNFPRKKQRIMVSLAGPVSTFVLWALSLWLFYFSQSEQGRLFWLVVSVSETFGLLMNFNPFIRMDSYYMLSDGLGISNLRTKAFGLIDGWFKRHIGIHSPRPVYAPAEYRALVVYALLGSIVTIFFFLLPIAQYISYLTGNEGNPYVKAVWGIFIVFASCCYLLTALSKKYKEVRHQQYKLK